ncbi:MAG: YjgP/YjgQ family permease [Armatimonadetes bacterium]|nr:YjgP/YjgQ family permease [Armatimonadota bacterium]
MTLLDRLIFRELFPYFLFGVGLFTTLLFAGGYIYMFTEYAIAGVPLWLVLELAALYLPQIAVKTLPMGMLLAALLGFGRLSSDWEITALRGAGASLRRLAMPVLTMGLAVSLFALLFNETVVPWATAKANSIRSEILKQIKQPGKLAAGFPQWKDGRPESFVLVTGGRDPKTNELFDVTVIKFGEEAPYEPVALAFAERAVWEGGREWAMYNGWIRFPNRPDGTFARYPERMDIKVTDPRIRKDPNQIRALETEVDAKTFGELREMIADQRKEGMEPRLIRQMTVELYNKINLPLASLVFGLVGAPLGIRKQRSGAASGFALSLAVIFFYWVLARYLIIVGGGGVIPPWFASALPNVLGILAAGWLLAKKER